MLQELKNEDFKSSIEQGGLVIVDFWASWCGPCRTLLPIMDKLSEEVTSVPMYKVNVDAESEVAISAGVRNLPTLIFYKDGNVVTKLVGLQTRENLMKVIQENS